MKVLLISIVAIMLSACATTHTSNALTDQQHFAYDKLFQGCLEQRLYESVNTYIDQRLALAQVGNFRYESFICECTAEAAAKRPYVAAMLERSSRGEQLNDAGARILKSETAAALMQCSSDWLDRSAAVMVDQLGSESPSAP